MLRAATERRAWGAERRPVCPCSHGRRRVQPHVHVGLACSRYQAERALARRSLLAVRASSALASPNRGRRCRRSADSGPRRTRRRSRPPGPHTAGGIAAPRLNRTEPYAISPSPARPPATAAPTLPTGIVLRVELLAGLVVALALIPEAISFSIIAGVDPQVGLYASFTMAVTIAFAGGRPAMISAATGAMALVVVVAGQRPRRRVPARRDDPRRA